MVHAVLTLTEGSFSPKGREVEYARTHRLITQGPFAKRHWRIGIGVGIVLPVLLLLLPLPPALGLVAAVLALVGLYAEEDILVRAGQALSIS